MTSPRLTETLTRLVLRMLRPLERRVRLMVSRGIVERVDDATKGQTLQVSLLADELRDDVEHFHPFGFTSVPMEGAEVLVVCVSGNRDHPIAAVVTDKTARPTGLQPGEVALHREDGVPRVKLTELDEVHLGESPSDLVALAPQADANDDAIKANLDSLRTALNGWVPAPSDGGAALKTALTTWLASSITLTSSAATEVKAK